MKINKIFAYLLICLMIGYDSLYGMMQVPPVQAGGAVRASDIAKYTPFFSKAKSVQLEVPKVQLSQSHVNSLVQENSKLSRKVQRAPQGFRAPAGGWLKYTTSDLMSRKDAAGIFGVAENASLTPKEIQQEYKKLARQRHPDVSGGSTAAMQELNRAKEILESGDAHDFQEPAQSHRAYSARSYSYEPTIDDFSPREQIPEGYWKYIGKWKRTVIDQYQEPGWFFREARKPQLVYWTRNLVAQNGAVYTERAELQYEYRPEKIGDTVFNFAVPTHITYQLNQNESVGLAKEALSDIPEIFKKQGIEFSNEWRVSPQIGTFGNDVSEMGIKKERLIQEIPAFAQFDLQHVPTGPLPKLEIKFINEKKGYGVIALQNIPKGTFIRPYAGELLVVPNEETTQRAYSANITLGAYPLIIDAEKIGNESRYCNHSYTPNMQETFLINDAGYVQEWLQAIKDIKKGEELTWSYGSGYWRGRDILPEEEGVRHLFQNKGISVHTVPKEGKSTLFINAQPFVHGIEVLGADAITIGDNTYITIAKREGDQALPLVLVQDPEKISVLQDIGQVDPISQQKIIESFERAVAKRNEL